MDYIQVKYIGLVSSRLRNFRKKNASLWNFSCPFCGDSQTDRRRARGFLYEKDNKLRFKCFKCEKPVGSFDNFLKEFDAELYGEYIREKFQRPEPEKELVIPQTKKPKLTEKEEDVNIGLCSIDQLSMFNPFKRYVVNRKIPPQFYSSLFACSKFKSYTNKFIPGKFSEKSLYHDESRLLIPFYDENKKMFAYSGRSLDKDAYLRYINIVLDETKPKLFGLERFDKTRDAICCEGAIDSLFLDNALASAGGDIVSTLRGLEKDQFTIVYDNEPFSKHTKYKIEKAINADYKVCIWPASVPFKDVNKMILEGYSSNKIERIIKDNTFKGLQALNELYHWSKK